VALLAVDVKHAVLRSRGGPTLMQSPSHSTLLGSPSTQWSNFSPRAAAHCSSFIVPLTETSSSSPVIRNEIEPLPSSRGLPPWSLRYCSHRGDAAGDAALHVDGAAAIEIAVLDGRPRTRHGSRRSRRPAATTSVCPAKVRCGAPLPRRA